MSSSHAPWMRHPEGITTVDAEYIRPGFAAVHLIERGGRVGVIDTGTSSSLPLVVQAMTELGLPPDAVDWVFLTHVHLDHAAGTGPLIQRFPRAQVIVHPRGAPHVIDPTRLQAAAIAVYGQPAFDKLYGRLEAVPRARVRSTHDDERLHLGGSEMLVLHTPGHALHHQVLFDLESKAVFTGDTFGLSYRELDTTAGPFILPTTTPTQFDPRQLADSIERIVALGPESAYLTHYGRVQGIRALAEALREQIEAFVAVARQHQNAPHRSERIRSALYDCLVARARAHGIGDAENTVKFVLGPDLELNAQGLVAWLARSQKNAEQ